VAKPRSAMSNFFIVLGQRGCCEGYTAASVGDMKVCRDKSLRKAREVYESDPGTIALDRRWLFARSGLRVYAVIGLGASQR